MAKNLRRLACKFDLDQSESNSSQVNARARKASESVRPGTAILSLKS